MLPTPPTLRDEPAARPDDGREVREQRVVVGDPMEGRRREHGVDRLRQRQRLPKVGDDVLDPLGKSPEALARRLDHRGRAVESHHVPSRESRREQLGDPARAATRVEDTLVTGQWQAVEHAGAPARHRVGDQIVGPGVPVPKHRLGAQGARYHGPTDREQRGGRKRDMWGQCRSGAGDRARCG